MMALLLAQVIALAAHGEDVAVVRQDGIQVSGRPLPVPFEQPAGAAYSRDGRLAVFGGRAGESGGVSFGGWTISPHRDLVTCAAFGPDWIATGSHDRTIRIHDLQGRPLKDLRGHSGPVLALAASPDGSLLASGAADSTVRFWDPSAGRLVRTLASHGDRVNALAWNPAGTRLASASRDGSLRIWQPSIGRLIRIIPHGEELIDVVWPGDLVTASAAGRIRFLPAEGVEVLREWDAGGRAAAIASTSSGLLIAVGNTVTPLR